MTTVHRPAKTWSAWNYDWYHEIASQNTSIYFNTSCLLATFVSIETATSPNSAISSFSWSSLKKRTKRNPNNLNLFTVDNFLPLSIQLSTKAKARDNTPNRVYTHHRDDTRHRENTRQRGNTCYRHQFLKKMSRLSLILSPSCSYIG